MNSLLDTILATLSNTDRSYLQKTLTNHRRWSLASTEDIKAWFSHYHISNELRDLYNFQTGEEMLQYGEELLENYEQHMQIYSRAFVKKYDGDELLPHEFQRFTQAIKQLLELQSHIKEYIPIRPIE